MALGPSTVTVSYGSFTFSGMPTPYVSRSQEMVFHGKKWAQITAIQLEGSVIGASATTAAGKGNYVSLNRERDEVLGAFSKDFQTLTVTENAVNILEFPRCIVKSLNFSEGNQGKIDYSISLECYLESEFNGAFGVVDPENTFSYEEQENGLVSISHSISARGVHTGTSTASPNQALNNAIDFVHSLSGSVSNFGGDILFVKGLSASDHVLESISKNVDRTSATYSMELKYVTQTGVIHDVPLIGGYVSEVTTAVTSGIASEYIKVDVDYRLRGGKTKTATEVRNQASGLSVFGVGSPSLYQLATGAAGFALNKVPITYDVQDNAETSRSVSINASYNNDSVHDGTVAGVYFDYRVSIETDEITEVTSVSIDGELKSRGGERNKYEVVNNYYENQVVGYSQGAIGFLWALANPVYTGRLGSSSVWDLNDVPTSFTVRKNGFKGEITINASFDNKDFLSGFSEASYNLSVDPSLNLFSVKPSANKNGIYGVYDLGVAKRETIGIGGNFVAQDSNINYKNTVANFIDSGKSEYVGPKPGVSAANPIILESEEVNVVPAPYNTVGFSYNYSRQGDLDGKVFH